MRWREGPWWVPAILLAAFWLAVTQAPEQTGAITRATIDGIGQALDAAVGDTTIELPTPEDAP